MTREEAINTVRNIYQTDKEKEALATLIPELRESEDERIRRWLCDYFSSIDEAWIHKDITCIDILRWLEKQKEQKEELVYRLNGLMQDYIKEGKDDEEKEHRLKCYQLFWDALEDTNFFEQKEQKLTATINGEPIPTENYSVDIPLAELKEDTQLLAGDYAISHYEQGKTYSASEVHKMLADAFIAGKSYHKPAEWRHYIWATNLRFDFTALIKYDNTDNYEIVQAGNRPKQEKNGVYILIKDIKPQSHWKPSEEQMKALLNAEGFLRAGLQHDSAKTIAELYEHLKKL